MRYSHWPDGRLALFAWSSLSLSDNPKPWLACPVFCHCHSYSYDFTDHLGQWAFFHQMALGLLLCNLALLCECVQIDNLGRAWASPKYKRKFAVPMYVCMCVAIRCQHVLSACAICRRITSSNPHVLGHVWYIVVVITVIRGDSALAKSYNTECAIGQHMNRVDFVGAGMWVCSQRCP